MTNSTLNNDSTNTGTDKGSLRREAPQKHGVKSKKTKKVNPETAAARQALIAMSQEAQDMMEMAENGMELEGFAGCEKINDFLLVMHQKATGFEQFKTFHDWKKAGYKVKKGAKSYRVWGSPLKAKKQGEEQQAEAAPETEGKSDAGKTFKFWPMCSLFTENQVERIEDGDESQETEKQEPLAAPAEQETKPVEKVKVAEFRGQIEHLERVFNVDRHACVGDKEKSYWSDGAKRVLAALEVMQCPRATSSDRERCASIIVKVKAYLADNPEPTPPKPSKKTQQPQAEAAKDAATIVSEAVNILERRIKVPGVQIGSSKDARLFCQMKIGSLEHEVFAALFLDTQHQLIEFKEMFRGSINSCSVHAREVVKEALTLNAAAVIFLHNHPSGVLTPSESDIRITEQLIKALTFIDVRVVDHMIVSSTDTLSFSEKGLI